MYFAIGFLLLALLPLADEIRQFAAVYRTPESMKRVAPLGMVALLVAMMALAALYALAFRGDGFYVGQGVRFGFLVGVFAAGSFVLHNYVSLNIGLRLALLQAVAYFVQWLGSGVVIALIYRPAKL